MLTFISCAKTMASHCSLKVPEVTVPYFEAEAVRNALEMSQVSAAELEKLLKVNAKIAAENRARFHDFCSEDNRPMPAIGAYTGAVFKRILPKDFTADDFRYAQEHLRITSFLYGLLRPLDGIRPYRLEGDVRLPEKGGITMFDYWKPLLTDYFIEEIKKQIKLCIEMNENENTTTQNLWDSVKAVLRGRFIAIQAYLKKQEKNQINNLILHLMQIEKEEMKNPRVSRREEIIKIRAEINEK